MSAPLDRNTLAAWAALDGVSGPLTEVRLRTLFKRAGELYDKPPTVVILDDDAAILEALRSLLNLKGYSAQAFSSAAATLGFCHTTPADLVITDLNMPGTDGLAFIRALRRIPKCQKVPIMIYSSVPVQQVIAKVKELKINAFVQKPGDFKTILEKVLSLVQSCAAAAVAPETETPPKE